MGANWGHSLRLSIFGESHGKAIGINIDGLASGIDIDFESIERDMGRRAPGKNSFSTQRKESDSFEILSGICDGKTTGAPLCAIIRNEDKKSKDYSKLKEVMRPSHSDYSAYIKYRGYNDVRGGGHFSGRITAPLVFAGSLAKSILAKKGIYVGAMIKSIKNLELETPNEDRLSKELFDELAKKELAILDEKKIVEIKEEIERARMNQDSVGGTIECFAIGVPAGLGEPFFDSLESSIAHLAFSVPAVKGIEFGKGFDISKMRGSEANDEYYLENGNIKNSVNFPAVNQPRESRVRLCITNKNMPNILARISKLFADHNLNIENMVNRSRGDYAYTLIDTNDDVRQDIIERIEAAEGIINVRVIK